jgi:Histidine kinase-like ATPase domain
VGQTCTAPPYAWSAAFPRPFLVSTCHQSGASGTGHRADLPAGDPGSHAGAGGAFHPLRSPVTDAPTRQSYLEMEAQPDAVPVARRCTRNALEAWHLGAIASDVELIVSEIVTNAVAASEAPSTGTIPAATDITATAPGGALTRAGAAVAAPARVGLYLAADPDRLTVLVWDASPQPPVRRPHEYDAIAGRGLEIVEALSTRWGWSMPSERGKVVWAVLDLDGSEGS